MSVITPPAGATIVVGTDPNISSSVSAAGTGIALTSSQIQQIMKTNPTNLFNNSQNSDVIKKLYMLLIMENQQ